MKALYPLKFAPIFKERIWGGRKLETQLHKTIPEGLIGESWELSDVEGDTSTVTNGLLEGMSLKDIQKKYKEDLIGKQNYKVFGNKFPLLIKFIDAKLDLSIQLHPNDELAKKRHNSFGKTEMWYVLQADENSKLIVDFNTNINKESYLQHLEAKTLPSIMNAETVKAGDTYFIEVGRDTEMAIDAINFDMDNDFKASYNSDLNTSNSMVSCQYFTTNYLPIEGVLQKENTYD